MRKRTSSNRMIGNKRRLLSDNMAMLTTSTANYEDIKSYFKIDTLTDEQCSALDGIYEGRDVFVATRTGSGKSLTYECFPFVFPGKLTIIIAPLISIMEEQCRRLESFGFKATYLGMNPTQNNAIENGMFDFVFGSPEAFLGRWRRMLMFQAYQERLGLIVVDEAHTVIQWGKGSKHELPFRECFSQLGQLRSLCPRAQMVALTATAGPVQRRSITRSLCFQHNYKIVQNSADRNNIKISSKCISNKEEADQTFIWIFAELHRNGRDTPRHVIFCETIADVTKVYLAFVREFGNNCPLFNMFHSKTNEKVKDLIRHDMSLDGQIRILICSNAAGMGVNYYGLNNVIHYGLPRSMDSFVQQMGRAGRDGTFSQELVIFKPNKKHLSKVEIDLVRLVKDVEHCKHEIICSAYVNERIPIVPLHNCCDACEKKCNCATSICPNQHISFLHSDENDSDEEMEREVTESEKQNLKHKLITYKYSLTDQAGLSIMHSDITHGFTDSMIDKIVTKSNIIFSSNDIMKHFPIWSYEIADNIILIISDIFGDTDMYNCVSDDDSDSS